MKVFFILFLFPHLSYSQEKGVNVIRVKNVDFNQVVNILLDKGYSIEKIDKNFQIVRTEPKSYSNKVGGMIKISIRVKDSTAIITGECGLKAIDFTIKEGIYYGGSYGGRIENRGMKGSLLKESFQVLNEFAQSLKGEIIYSKE
jgi:hypothetical protein